jgi:hypothetical protein
MEFATNSKIETKNASKQVVKIAILLMISLGLFWFSEDFSLARFFEPHTCPGGRCQGSIGWVLWVSYAKDLIQPFALYFFLCLGERRLKTWQLMALLAFGIPTLLEFGQLLYYRVASGHYVGAFDPIDILMHAISVGLAVFYLWSEKFLRECSSFGNNFKKPYVQRKTHPCC